MNATEITIDVAITPGGKIVGHNLTEGELSRMREAFGRCWYDFDAALVSPVIVEYGEAGWAGSGQKAWGRVVKHLLRIDPDGRSIEQQYAALLLAFHVVAADKLSSSSRRDLMDLMAPPATSWTGDAYRMRALQCAAHAAVVIFSDIKHVLEGWHQRQIPPSNYAKAAAIWSTALTEAR